MKTPMLLACALGAVASARAGDLGTCEVTVDGAMTASGKSNGGASEVGTDYWFQADELAQAVKMLHTMGKKGADADKAFADAMKGDPKNYALIFNCAAGDLRISFLPGNGSKYADVPFGPKKYTVIPGSGKAGEMQVLASLKGKSYRVSEPGELDVTAFSANRFAGTFAFKAQAIGTKEAVAVTGKFDYPCSLPTKFCQEARAKK